MTLYILTLHRALPSNSKSSSFPNQSQPLSCFGVIDELTVNFKIQVTDLNYRSQTWCVSRTSKGDGWSISPPCKQKAKERHRPRQHADGAKCGGRAGSQMPLCVCQNWTTTVHRAVVASASPVFERMLEASMQEGIECRVDLRGDATRCYTSSSRGHVALDVH